MGVIKLIAPTALIATLALFAPHADAQTMGEYATTTASAADGAGGAGGLGSSIGSVVNSVNSDSSGDLGGGSRTWGASSLGGSFEERAGAASGSSGGAGFDARAGSESGSRFPTESRFSDSGDRFGDSAGRFADTDRFGQSQFQDQDRFPAGVLDQNREGLDSHYSSSSGLDHSYSAN